MTQRIYDTQHNNALHKMGNAWFSNWRDGLGSPGFLLAAKKCVVEECSALKLLNESKRHLLHMRNALGLECRSYRLHCGKRFGYNRAAIDALRKLAEKENPGPDKAWDVPTLTRYGRFSAACRQLEFCFRVRDKGW